jgi:hypothetical protein
MEGGHGACKTIGTNLKEEIMSDPVIPKCQPYNEIDVTLSLTKGADPCIAFQTLDHKSLVHLDTEPSDCVAPENLPQLQLDTYCRFTKILLRAGDGGYFDPSLANPSGDDDKLIYQAVVCGNGSTIEIDVHNVHRVADPASTVPEKASLALLKATLRSADGSRSCTFSICLVAPPYRWVEVVFSAGAEGKGNFSYSGDIDTKTDPPSIQTPRDAAVYFTLTAEEGVTFDEEPFDFEVDDPAKCIIDVGTNGKEAILTDLYNDRGGTEHCFYIQVMADGKLYRSEDPTIVNVDPSDPPDGSACPTLD